MGLAMADKWNEALRHVGRHEDRGKVAELNFAKITHDYVRSIQSMLDSPDFSGARRYFFYSVDREHIHDAHIQICFKRKGMFFGFFPRAWCVSAIELQSLKVEPLIGLSISSMPGTSDPVVTLNYPEGAIIANPWFCKGGHSVTPNFKIIDNDWRLYVQDSVKHLVTNECSLGEYLLFFMAAGAKTKGLT